MPAKQMTEEEVRALPLMVNPEVAGRAIGMGRQMAYELVRAGEFPVRLRPGGKGRVRIARADILAYLGLAPAPAE